MIDRYLLRYLLAVVDKGNFSRAAAQCGVSQPTLSVGIARLEAETGKTLFLRSNRRVELTGDGARLVERARRIEREFTLAEQETSADRFGTVCRLGVISTLPSRWIEAAMTCARQAAPDERIEIVEANERTLRTHLARGRLDTLLTLVRADREDFAEPLFEEGYRLAMPPDHALATQGEVKAEELADHPMIVRRHCEALPETSRHFTARGVRPFLSVRTTSDEQAIAFIRAGYGLTVLPAGYADERIAAVPLAGFDLVRTIGFIHDRGPAARSRPAVLAAIGETLVGLHQQASAATR